MDNMNTNSLREAIMSISSVDISGEYQPKVSPENSVPKTTEIVLVAPNKHLQKQWRKENPGIKVVLESEYKGYPLPSKATKYLGIQHITKEK
jgi:hypothetical protein